MNLKLGPYTIILHIQPLHILEYFAQHDRKSPESGGILLGKLINDEINILKLSIPTSLDRGSRTNFERNKIGAQIILDYEFQNSNGQLTYLGEWHTHPEKIPTPSHADLHMLNNQYKYNSLQVDFVLLLIKGTKGLYLRMIGKKGTYDCKIYN